MIEIKNLTKVYKLNKKQMKESKTKSNRKVAVDHLSLNAHKGEIYGLLGPNGAGKTTTLRCIATIIKPTEGEVKVAGLISPLIKEKHSLELMPVPLPPRLL